MARVVVFEKDQILFFDLTAEQDGDGECSQAETVEDGLEILRGDRDIKVAVVGDCDIKGLFADFLADIRDISPDVRIVKVTSCAGDKRTAFIDVGFTHACTPDELPALLRQLLA